MTDSSDISEQDKDLFRNSVGSVKPIRQEQLVHTKVTAGQGMQHRTTRSRQHSRQGNNAGNPEAGRLLEAGDEMFYKRPGVQHKLIRKLKRGQFRIEATADLHGETINKARQSLKEFLRACHNRNKRCVLLIHGKGHGSANRKPVIKNRVNGWLRESGNVLAFCSARPEDGGSGAVYVLLKTSMPVQENNS